MRAHLSFRQPSIHHDSNVCRFFAMFSVFFLQRFPCRIIVRCSALRIQCQTVTLIEKQTRRYGAPFRCRVCLPTPPSREAICKVYTHSVIRRCSASTRPVRVSSALRGGRQWRAIADRGRTQRTGHTPEDGTLDSMVTSGRGADTQAVLVERCPQLNGHRIV